MLWIPHKQQKWAARKFLEVKDNCVLCENEDGAQSLVEMAMAMAYHPSHEMGVGDLLTIQQLNSAALLNTLKIRHLKKLFVCSCGAYSIVVNSFNASDLKRIPSVTGGLEQFEPSAYDIPNEILNDMWATRRQMSVAVASSSLPIASTSIILTGKSGAGKTNIARVIMDFLVKYNTQQSVKYNRQSYPSFEATNRINNLIESFGCCRTSQSSTSSRFVRYSKFYYSSDVQLVSIQHECVFFEASRVVSDFSATSDADGCFFIFKQLLHCGEHVSNVLRYYFSYCGVVYG
jgi:myosin heavy subunit